MGQKPLLHEFNVRQLEGFVPELLGAAIETHDGNRSFALSWNPIRFHSLRVFRTEVNVHAAVRIHSHIGFVISAQTNAVQRVVNEGRSCKIVDNQSPNAPALRKLLNPN
jgi:hypothetical protein